MCSCVIRVFFYFLNLIDGNIYKFKRANFSMNDQYLDTSQPRKVPFRQPRQTNVTYPPKKRNFFLASFIFIVLITAVCYFFNLLPFSAFYFGIPAVLVLVFYYLLRKTLGFKNEVNVLISMFLAAIATYLIWVNLPKIFL